MSQAALKSAETMPMLGGVPMGPTALLALRVVSGVMAAIVSSVIIYTCISDGSPFRMELLTPWMAATLVDFYGLVALICVVLILAEESIAMGLFWCVVVATLGAGALWAWVFLRSVLVLGERDPWARLVLSQERAKGLGYTRTGGA